MADWRIEARRAACAACQRDFEDGEPHYSLLRVSDAELAREDLCRTCFRARDESADVVFWRTRHRAKRGGLRLDLESLEALFQALEPRAETHLRELRFLLALILMRKRRLKVVRIVRAEHGEAFAVRRPRREEELLVYVFELAPARQAELREELVRIFDQPELAALDMRPEQAGASGAALAADTPGDEAGTQ